tara:strand:+ start:116 stop:397 length:282 start_codon:yes stop_codon:yes gene_type:complete
VCHGGVVSTDEITLGKTNGLLSTDEIPEPKYSHYLCFTVSVKTNRFVYSQLEKYTPQHHQNMPGFLYEKTHHYSLPIICCASWECRGVRAIFD